MSVESAKTFIERMETDEDFAGKVNECKDAMERMAFVKSEGFDFTAVEVQEAMGILGDELDCVVGGFKPNNASCTTNDHAWACRNGAGIH